MQRSFDDLDPADIVPFQYGQDDTPAVQPQTADTEEAPPSGENPQQQLTDSVNRLNETMTKLLKRQADQPPKSEKLQPAVSLNDLFAPEPEHPDHEQQPEPEQPEEPEPEPITFEQTATASMPAGFQQQQQAGHVDMGQGLNAGGEVVGQLQAALQAQNDANQKTLQILQTVQGIVTQQIQMQTQYARKLEEIGQQMEGLKAIVEEQAGQIEELQTQQRNPQAFKGNP